ncbi:MAG: dTMP kinase [Gemmatimonadetes bacterium]|nr:dTMP kinase [Gemmatimonadota bacterium]
MSDRPPFIALEGAEGAGKSILLKSLADDLAVRGVAHVLTREPGGTPTGEALREHIWKRPELSIDGVTELLLLSAARHAHVREIIRPALAAGAVVITDRYEMSTRVYQGFGRGIDLAMIASVTDVAVDGLYPDLYIVLDIDPELGRRRQREAGHTPDRIEREDEDFMRRVSAGYRRLAEEDEAVVLVDARDDTDSVRRAVFSALERRFPRIWR